MKNSEQPAFAVSREMCEMPNGQINIEEYPFGLTKREYFAGLSLQGVIAIYEHVNFHPSFVAQKAIQIADELLKQLEADTQEK